ncbi:hypothetical protein FC52_GL000542 [Lactobacillus pasteurii DSM 23907 = CRBIP 24.76]|uniref:Uncharacterized protein n=1 Tax=Lactobacillus pasteurii DSM 23907 = CRBIP 24.76 TaxID=1423790 RepID=I7J0Y4_9LACO|nr:hypothetical protein [Lactobacillus pasteurii]KRK08841.1 hypothetical protein FC52_GL000542 [Lactobacillus pasteurii DSM 23907 = CRBIP 24.76]TDG76324.1 hypothetical protein C5L33_001083 [Lactobacillus pasteurii]CCI85952.1 Putative uncharacterized protein [Lactobacillus pasteurii DSM 23907 = CRBIP 24.76]
MNKYEEILDQLVDGKLAEYEVEAKDAFEFQSVLRGYGRRQSITGEAKRGGNIIYTSVSAQK